MWSSILRARVFGTVLSEVLESNEFWMNPGDLPPSAEAKADRNLAKDLECKAVRARTDARIKRHREAMY